MTDPRDDAEIVRDLVLGELAAVNVQNPRALAGHFAEDCEFVDLSDGSRLSGRTDFLADLLALFAAVPDLHVVERRVVADGGVAAAEIKLSGNPVSEWRGHLPAGRPFVWDTCSFYELHTDRRHLLRERMYYDAAAIDRQLGPPV